jgi:hypothetical protein
MLTLQGYKIHKDQISNIHDIKGKLNIKPFIPSVFVKPQFVQRYNIFTEDSDYLYIPKHYGIQNFGMFWFAEIIDKVL